MFLNTSIQKSDTLGALASGLCLLHCIATPFIFVAQTCSASCAGAPLWWSAIDFLFLGISFFAIYWSAKTTTKAWIKSLLWASWGALLLIILNEKAALIPIPSTAIYLPAIGLVVLHVYNLKYCQCQDGEFCEIA